MNTCRPVIRKYYHSHSSSRLGTGDPYNLCRPRRPLCTPYSPWVSPYTPLTGPRSPIRRVVTNNIPPGHPRLPSQGPYCPCLTRVPLPLYEIRNYSPLCPPHWCTGTSPYLFVELSPYRRPVTPGSCCFFPRLYKRAPVSLHSSHTGARRSPPARVSRRPSCCLCTHSYFYRPRKTSDKGTRPCKIPLFHYLFHTESLCASTRVRRNSVQVS